MDANVQPCAMDASDVQPLADEAEQPLIVAGYNIGLTSNIVFDAKSKQPLSGLCDFTSRLIADVNEAFGASIGMHALFLCEVGSQETLKHLDLAMKQRKACADNAAGSVPPPALVAFCDECDTVDQWLKGVVACIECPNLTYCCKLPYAAIWSTDFVTLMQKPCMLHDVAGSDEPDRRALLWRFLQVSSSLDFQVALCHSPSSVANWKKLTDHRRETVFHTLAQAVGARINNKEPGGGKVVDVLVDTTHQTGSVCVVYSSTLDAECCAHHMNGRWFAGQNITARISEYYASD